MWLLSAINKVKRCEFVAMFDLNLFYTRMSNLVIIAVEASVVDTVPVVAQTALRIGVVFLPLDRSPFAVADIPAHKELEELVAADNRVAAVGSMAAAVAGLPLLLPQKCPSRAGQQ